MVDAEQAVTVTVIRGRPEQHCYGCRIFLSASHMQRGSTVMTSDIHVSPRFYQNVHHDHVLHHASPMQCRQAKLVRSIWIGTPF
jgi:hypothetical protein